MHVLSLLVFISSSENICLSLTGNVDAKARKCNHFVLVCGVFLVTGLEASREYRLPKRRRKSNSLGLRIALLTLGIKLGKNFLFPHKKTFLSIIIIIFQVEFVGGPMCWNTRTFTATAGEIIIFLALCYLSCQCKT